MPWILIYYIRNMKFNSSEPIQIHSIKIIGMWPNFVKTTKAKFYKNIKKKKGPNFFLDMWLAVIGRESILPMVLQDGNIGNG